MGKSQTENLELNQIKPTNQNNLKRNLTHNQNSNTWRELTYVIIINKT